MLTEDRQIVQEARTAPIEAIPGVLGSASEEVLDGLLDNPLLDETHVVLLLERKDLSALLLEKISKRKIWLASYRVRRALAAHPHVPRAIAMRTIRDLYLMDLVRISLLPTSSGELRRLAEERVLAQLPQLPLGQKLMLARRGSSRVAAALIAHGPEQVSRIALDNSFLTEAQLLKTLAGDSFAPRIIAIVARHKKWSVLVNVRVALLRLPHTPEKCVAAFVPDLPGGHIEELLALARLPGGVRERLLAELARRE